MNCFFIDTIWNFSPRERRRRRRRNDRPRKASEQRSDKFRRTIRIYNRAKLSSSNRSNKCDRRSPSWKSKVSLSLSGCFVVRVRLLLDRQASERQSTEIEEMRLRLQQLDSTYDEIQSSHGSLEEQIHTYQQLLQGPSALHLPSLNVSL